MKKKVMLYPNPFKDPDLKALIAAKQQCDGLGADSWIPSNIEHAAALSLIPELRAIIARPEECISDTDMIICLGGDGTILHVSRLASEREIPVLGVNVGNVGFMVELEQSELPMISDALRGEGSVDRRMMLDVSVIRAGEEVFRTRALNDAVVCRGSLSKIVRLDVLTDGHMIFSHSGDGVIVATPSGSTAYSMSAGGPIVEPHAENIIITPICARDRNTQSFVLPPEREVRVRIGRLQDKATFLIADGGDQFALYEGDEVVCTRSERVLKLVRLKNQSFYDLINVKLKRLGSF